MTCYGGGFACIPAYIADLFGTKQLGAIHGYILTAWAAAGLVGPMFVAWIRQATGSYAGILTVFLGFFLVALIISLVIRLDIRRLKAVKIPEGQDFLVEKTFEADIGGIATAAHFITAWAEKAGLAAQKVFHLQLAFEEAATNICGHAYLEEIAINR